MAEVELPKRVELNVEEGMVIKDATALDAFCWV
jgi:hypothetical protein